MRAQRREAGDPVRITAPAIVMGAGIGGFIDGIVAHQIFQWHGMLTQRHPNTTLENMERNMFADGLFHVVTLGLVLAGSYLLWARASRGAWRWSWRSLTGWMLVGWGLFNLIEGILNHHLFRLHRVNPEAAAPLVWDIGFLLLGALLVVGGSLLARGDTPRDTT